MNKLYLVDRKQHNTIATYTLNRESRIVKTRRNQSEYPISTTQKTYLFDEKFAKKESIKNCLIGIYEEHLTGEGQDLEISTRYYFDEQRGLVYVEEIEKYFDSHCSKNIYKYDKEISDVIETSISKITYELFEKFVIKESKYDY